MPYLDAFLVYLQDWAITDALSQSLVISKKEQKKMWDYIIRFQKDPAPYNVRFLAVMMLTHYLNDEYIKEVLNVLDTLNQDHYYIKMGVAWALATIMGQYPELCFAYLQKSNLNKWTYNKALQKMIESFRVS